MQYIKNILISNENYKVTYYTKGNGSKKCIIIFGEIDSNMEEIGFSSKLIMSEGFDYIYVVQKIYTNYQHLSAESFKNIVNEVIADKDVYTYGSSLEGYCAIYYGGAINANILAMNPRNSAHPVIKQLCGYRFKNKGFYHNELNEADKTNKKVSIFYDKNNHIDSYYINIFLKSVYPNAVYYNVENAGHYTARALFLSGELKNIALDFFNNNKINFNLDKDKILDWHFERTKKRIKQGKLNHAKENLDVLLFSKRSEDDSVKNLFRIYKDNLYMQEIKKTKGNKKTHLNNSKKKSSPSFLALEKGDKFKKHGINTNKKGFRRYYKANLLNTFDEDYLDEVKEYWLHQYGKKIDPVLHLAYTNLTGKKDPRVIPGKEMWNEIIPFLNDMNIRIGYSDKNIYDKFMNIPNSTETVLKRVRGHYFRSNNLEINRLTAYNLLTNSKSDLIIKPSDTDNGKGIEKLTIDNGKLYLKNELVEISNLESMYGFNFIVEKVIVQHPIMAAPHPASVNTLRMVTLRWDNEIQYLSTFARFGSNQAVNDNAGTGGIAIGITDSGEFMDYAVDENANVYKHHPSTNYSFENYAKVPNFEGFKQFVIDAHKDILHHDFVSWDIAVGINGEPVFIEANYRGATWLYQFATQKPLFGDLTDDVLQYVSSEIKKNKFARNVQSNIPKLKSKNKDIKDKNKKLKEQNEKIKKQIQKKGLELGTKEKELNHLKKEYKKILKSRSWKFTSPFRKLVRAYKRIAKKGQND